VSHSPGVAQSTGSPAQLRRYTSGGIILVALFGVSPSFKAEEERRGWQGCANCSKSQEGSAGLMRLSPNNRLQRSVTYKVHGARTRHAIGRPTCALIAHSSAAEPGR
jgi:hypothetical protein